jgi:hypothetical protein
MRQPLISPVENFLHNWGLIIVWAALGMRFALPMVLMRHSWVLDGQVVAVGLITCLLNLAGTLLAGPAGRAASSLLGLAAWLIAASMVKRYLWPTTQLPDWLVWTAVAMAALSFVYRAVKRRGWFAELQGHGWEWILAWAAGRPLYARALALRTVRSLGWRSERAAG